MVNNSYIGGSTIINLHQWHASIEPWVENSRSRKSSTRKIYVKIKTGPIKDDADKSKFTDFLLGNKADIESVLSTRIEKIQTHEDFLKYFLYSSIQWCQKNNAPLSHLISASVTGSTPRIMIKSRNEVRDYIKAIFSHIFPSLRYKINKEKYTLYQAGKAKHDEIETFLDFLSLIAKEQWELCRAVTKP